MKKLIKYSKLKSSEINKLLECFAMGVPALVAAKFSGVHRNTASRFYRRVREKIYLESTKRKEKLKGEIELDESYFGGRRKGKRGRGSFNKSIVFGILERKGIAKTILVEDVSAETLMK